MVNVDLALLEKLDRLGSNNTRNVSNKNLIIMKKNIAGFDLPQTKCDRLQRILDSRLNIAIEKQSKNTSYWDAGYFNLENATLFKNATKKQQKDILKLASGGLLEEAYFIEKAGMGYMAKMVMLSETTEERMLYSLFCADETTHLAKIMPFLDRIPVDTDDLF
ncbi:hypothetical protein, partial [Anaplasma marginale]|uniref:hypothetical protein n=1 Tax=Anaplasma marginale TaxID=770 RepID=UPI0018E9C70F